MVDLISINNTPEVNSDVKPLTDLPMALTSLNKRGRPVGRSNLTSKQMSGIAQRMRKAGLDWVADFALAIQKNNKFKITMYMRLLPYLVVTKGQRKAHRVKGRASKAALAALAELEQK